MINVRSSFKSSNNSWQFDEPRPRSSRRKVWMSKPTPSKPNPRRKNQMIRKSIAALAAVASLAAIALPTTASAGYYGHHYKPFYYKSYNTYRYVPTCYLVKVYNEYTYSYDFVKKCY